MCLQDMEVDQSPESSALEGRTQRLEARCNELQATVNLLLQRVERLETYGTNTAAPCASPIDFAMAESPIDLLLAEAELQDNDVPLVSSMAPAPRGADFNPESGVVLSSDIDELLREAENVARGVYVDDDVRELISMCSDITTPDDTSAQQAMGEMQFLLQEPAFQHEAEKPAAPAVTEAAAAECGPTVTEAAEDESGPTATEAAADESGTEGEVLHLILGDSLAAYLCPDLKPGHHLLNLAVRGGTWAREGCLLLDHLREWEQEAAFNGWEMGKIFLWLGGNDAYGRPNQGTRGLDEAAVTSVLTALSPYANRTIMAGPTPRLWCDAGLRYEDTVAFAANETLKQLASTHGMAFVPYLGRALTAMERRRHVVKPDIARAWFAPDGVHLSGAGYAKILRKLDDVFA